MKYEEKRFEQICKKSMGHRNPLISSRKYEIGPKKEKGGQRFGKVIAHKSLEAMMRNKSLYFPDRSTLNPSKIPDIEKIPHPHDPAELSLRLER